MCYPLQSTFLDVCFELMKGLLRYFQKLKNLKKKVIKWPKLIRKRTKQTFKNYNLNELVNEEFKII